LEYAVPQDKTFEKLVIRLSIVGIFILTAYSILIFKLWHEQVSVGATHLEKISRQSIRRIRTPAQRGRIYSADGHILANNIPRYDIKFYLAEMRRPGRRSKTVKHILAVEQELASAIGRSSRMTENKIIRHINLKPGLPMTVFTNLAPKEMGILHEIKYRYRGLDIEVTPERTYPNGSLFSHLLGFTRKADPGMAHDRKQFFYYLPDLTGKRGVEKLFNDSVKKSKTGKIRGLSGLPGSRLVMVDHRGFVHHTISTDIEAMNGNDIYLTLNFRAQKIAEQLLHDKKGAIILLDADDGAVIAMTSKPDFDPNIFTSGNSRAISRLYHQAGQPLLNRATNGVYTPGSIIKPLTGIALLENHLSPEATVVCDGATWIGDARIRCSSWRSGGHNEMNIIDAIKHSCNDFFIEQATKLSMEQLREILSSAGIGHKTGFSLPEKSGLAPSREYKKKFYKTAWNTYDTGLLAIGQGIITITPLQAAVFCAAIANGGTLRRPYILRDIRDQFGNLLYTNTPVAAGRLAASAQTLEIIRQGMLEVVQSPKGSGKNAVNSKIELYGKTGTAEVGSRANRRNNTWFICFGTVKEKTYAMVIMVENGMSGGKSCAPLAAEFFNRWLEKAPVK
jgi:penicillin-binding protein 2